MRFRGTFLPVLGIAAALAAAMPFHAVADTTGEKVRAVVARHKAAFARVSMVLEMKAAAGGRSLDAEEVSIELTAAAVDAEGLFLCADFAGLMAGQAGADGVALQLEIRSCKIVLPDGREFPARAECRDDETHLLFLRAEALAGKVAPLPAGGGRIDVGDAIVIMDLLSNRYPEPCARLARVNFRFDRPFLMFRYDDREPEPGQAAFDLDGNFVGVTSLFRETGAGGGEYHVVIPAERVKALQANAKVPRVPVVKPE